MLVGGAGADVLWGGAGIDSFRFRTASDGTTDRIGDFASGTDRLVLAHSVLVNAPEAGRMTDAGLSLGTVSGTSGQFLYVLDGAEGLLYWDADGNGASAATLLVILDGGPALVGSDIYIL